MLWLNLEESFYVNLYNLYKTEGTENVEGLLDFCKHCVSLLDSSNISLQFFPDIRKSDGLLISWISPANPSARLLKADIKNENTAFLLLSLPVEFTEVRYDTGTSEGLHIILRYSLGLSIIVGKTLSQVFPGLLVTSQLKTQMSKFYFLSIKNILLLLESCDNEGEIQWEVPPPAAINKNNIQYLLIY